MVNSKNTGDQIVYHLPRSMRVVGGILIGIGIFFFAIGMLGGSVIGWLALIIPFTLPGLFFYTYTAEWTFDHPRGYITIRRGFKPFPPLTTRTSKTDVKNVGTLYTAFGDAEGTGFGFGGYGLFLETSKRKYKLILRDEQTADVLADRIREFTRSP